MKYKRSGQDNLEDITCSVCDGNSIVRLINVKDSTITYQCLDCMILF
jgi:hypothetical protein